MVPHKRTREQTTLSLMLSSSSVPTHPVPVEAKAEAVQLLAHGLDITEETTQSSNVNVCVIYERS